MKLHRQHFLARLGIIVACLLLASLFAGAQTKGRNEVRATAQKFFDLLKSQQYAALYDFLPEEVQNRMTREQLTQSLRRLDGFIVIERMEIGRIQQRGDFAVVDTTLYGRLKRPLEINGQKAEAGKVAVQQYLFKEGAQWKLITADNNSRAHFLKQHPEFNRGFQLTQPQFFIKQNGRWEPLGRRQ
jgi:hypothetical protein